MSRRLFEIPIFNRGFATGAQVARMDADFWTTDGDGWTRCESDEYENRMRFRCSICRELHDAPDMAWHYSEPLPWLAATQEERDISVLTPDQCELVLNGETHRFIHALLQIPVHGMADPFVWGVWCSQSEATYAEVSALWESEDRVGLGPHFGWLCSRLPFYPDTLYLKTLVHQRAVGLRPTVEVEETDHPLSLDQRQGMRPDQLQQMIEELIHRPDE